MGDVDKVLRATPDVRWYETSRFAGRYFRRSESDFPASLRRLIRLNETESCLSETTLGWSVPPFGLVPPTFLGDST